MRTWAWSVAILVSACGARSTPQQASPPRPRPATPAATEIVRAMNEVTPAVVACLGGYPHQTIVVEVVLASTGTPSTVGVVLPESPGDPESPRSTVAIDADTRDCVADAIAPLQVAPFERPTFLVRYPFRAR